MRSALKTADNNVERVPNGGSCSLSSKALEQNHYKSSKDPEVSALIWGNSDQGYLILTFVAIEADHWKFVAPLPPLQGSEHRDQTGSGGNVNMDRFLVVSPTPAISLLVDPQRAQGSHSSDRAYSAKSLLASNLFQPSAHGQSRIRRLLNGRAKNSKFSENSQQKSSLSSNSSTLIDDGANTSCSADLVKDKRKADKPVKRSSKKKAKKRGKQSKKPVCSDGGPTGAEAICEESICQSSLSEACANNNLAWDERSISGDKSVENAMLHEGSLHNFVMDGSDSEKNNNCSVYHSEISTTAISSSSVEEESEAVMPMPQSPVSEGTVSNEIQPTSKVLSALKRKFTDKHQRNTSYSNDISSEVILDGPNASLLDLISDGWNSDVSVSTGGNTEEKSIIKENDGIDFTGHSSYDSLLDGPGKRYLFQENLSNGVVNSDEQAERIKCGSQGCSSSDFQMVLYGKRGRQGRKLFGNSVSMNKFGSGANVHGRSGKENNNSVWQKVRRNDVDECGCKSNSAPPVNSMINSDGILKSKGNNKSKVKTSEKMKQKPSAGSKQAYTHSRKRSPSCKTNSSGGTQMNLQQKEASEITTKVNHHKSPPAGSRSHCCIENSRGGSGQSCRIDNSLSESIHSSEVSLDEMKPLECVSPKVHDMDGQADSTQNGLSSGSAKLLDRKQLNEVHSDAGLYLPVNNGPAKSQTEAFHTESGKQDHHSGSVLQKWIPVVRQDAEMLATIGSSSLLASHQDESALNEIKITAEEELSSNAHSFVPLVDVEVEAVSSLNVSCPAPKDEGEIGSLRCGNSYETEKPSGINAVPNCTVTCRPKDGHGCVSETMPDKRAEAIKHSFKTQLASEGVHLASGRPLAEFERLLHSASPVLGQAHSIGKCQSSSHNQLPGASPCLHEKLDLSLGSLWQWYERHGSYGLEVKVEDYQSSKRMGFVLSEFRAYFVPFLSAVQLFGNSRGCFRNTCKEMPSIDVLKACEIDNALVNFADACDLPINSVLVPQPYIENQTSQSQNSSSSSEFSSASGQEGFSCLSLSTTCFGDLELLFEFFESAQPQHRPPLFEKIKELVRGGGTSNSQAYGDPSNLDSLSLHDLHPASWYSVAWYPIYRIPDGNFRAAFLTYHSLGHLIHRSASSDCSDVDTSIDCPVVGLQSYNAQGECWYQPRQNVETQPEEETSNFNHLKLLKERIRALEETADVMARGVVRKGSQEYTNRHPDYEFFLSRRRW